MVVLGTTIHEFATIIARLSTPIHRHPGLEPGSIHPPHVLLKSGPRLKAGVTVE
jgi:hypothetical protein